MSEEPLDLKRSLRSVWRHKVLVGLFVVLGLAGGAGYMLRQPPMVSSTALVVLAPSTHDTLTQVMIASSDPVLASALPSTHTGLSVMALRKRIAVKNSTYNVLSITAQGKTAAQAERTANAVAASYLAYVGSGRAPGRVVHGQVLSSATDATGTSRIVRLSYDAGVGGLSGLLIGAAIALAVSRSNPRLRERGEIAESIGVPVLASVPVRRPRTTAAWRGLLEAYQPSAVEGWRMRRVLEHLGVLDDREGDSSVTVLSLSTDRKALALGPQLAVFSASLGIRTSLIIGPQQDVNDVATLRAACTALPPSSRRSRNLLATVCDQVRSDLPPAALTVVIAVADAKAPKVAETVRTATTVLGVSAGATTAEQLARVAASTAADGRHIAGILVADPDSADHTTGRLPYLLLPPQRKAPMTRTPTETMQ